MQKIPSKQIDGVVDLSEKQTITGHKEFLAGLSSSAGATGHIPLIKDGFFYFVRDPEGESDGDFRMGVSSVSGMFCLQQRVLGQWSNVGFDEGISMNLNSNMPIMNPLSGPMGIMNQ